MARLSKLFSFTNWAATRPRDPLPGDRVDDEFSSHRKVINELDVELKDIRRADGKIASGVVEETSLAPDLLNKLKAPIDAAVQAAKSSGASSATIATDAANNALANAHEAQKYAQQAHLAADSVTQNIPGALSDINSAKAAALQAAFDAKNAAADISNAEKSAAADADLAHKSEPLAHSQEQYSQHQSLSAQTRRQMCAHSQQLD